MSTMVTLNLVVLQPKFEEIYLDYQNKVSGLAESKKVQVGRNRENFDSRGQEETERHGD